MFVLHNNFVWYLLTTRSIKYIGKWKTQWQFNMFDKRCLAPILKRRGIFAKVLTKSGIDWFLEECEKNRNLPTRWKKLIEGLEINRWIFLLRKWKYRVKEGGRGRNRERRPPLRYTFATFFRNGTRTVLSALFTRYSRSGLSRAFSSPLAPLPPFLRTACSRPVIHVLGDTSRALYPFPLLFPIHRKFHSLRRLTRENWQEKLLCIRRTYLLF